MKLAAYSCRPYETAAFDRYEKELGCTVIRCTETLSLENAELSKGCEGVSISGSGRLDRELMEALAGNGVKFIACRSIGYNHIDPAPIRRLASNYTGVRPEGVPGHNPEEFAAFKSITTQERFKGGCTLDLSIGKIIYLPGRQRVNLNLSVQNLTNRRDIITGGYEQGRINLKNPERFGNKHYYMQGINLFFNAGYIF